jgi:hypothetical protein
MGEPYRLKEKSSENTYYLQMMQTILANVISVQYFNESRANIQIEAEKLGTHLN